MPPATPSAISAMSFSRWIGLDRLDGLRHHFLLCDDGHLVLADRHTRRGAGQQLAGAGPGSHDERERVGQLASINHGLPIIRFVGSLKVRTMRSAVERIRSRRARSPTTMARKRPTAEATSSLTTMKSYSLNAAI